MKLAVLAVLASCVAGHPMTRKLLELVDKHTMASLVDPVWLNASLTSLSTDQPNRFYRDQNGVDGALWLKSQAEAFASSASRLGADTSVRQVDHLWMQPSIIARIEGTSNSSEMLIIGAHEDSTQNSNGAVDDGSGSITVLQIFKIFMETNFEPERPIEFHWYAAEEAGLLGSRAIASDYRENNEEVLTMLQVDMDAYDGATMINIVEGLLGNPRPEGEFLKDMIDAYSGECCGNNGPLPTKFGFVLGDSDHSSWNNNGYTGVFGIEDPMSPHIHTNRDTMDTVNIEFLAAYTPAAMAFITELSDLCPAEGKEACLGMCSFMATGPLETKGCVDKCGLICHD